MDQPISNPFKLQIKTAVAAAAAAGTVSADLFDVLDVMADSLKLSGIAFTNWRRINERLGREPQDKRVVETLADLRRGGWLARRKWGYDVLAIPTTATTESAV